MNKMGELNFRSRRTVESLDFLNMIGKWKLYLIFEYVDLENREQGNRSIARKCFELIIFIN